MTSTADLSARVERDPREQVPNAVVARAKSAFTRAAPPGTLATLAFDSDLEPRRLQFMHPDVAIDITVTADGDRRAVRARSEPSHPVTVERYEEPAATPVPVVDAVPVPARRGELLRVAAGGAHSEWFRV